MEKRKVGIMGGTFDPIHVGHLILGESAYCQFGLDKVLFMPSGNPPHKRNREGRASLEERIEMVRLAIADNPHFELSLAEAHEEGYTYTRVTLERLKKEYPDVEFYFIMGADSLFNFKDWKDPQRISQLATLVAATRYHISDEEIENAVAQVRQMFHAKVEKLSTPNMDISSKMIRNWISQKKPVRYYVPENVIRYIEGHQLYLHCE